MEILINDYDIINVIVDYLHSRRLFLSASSLEQECGLSPSRKLPECFETIREYSYDGQWDHVRKLIQAFASTFDNFPIKRILFLLFRQRFCELCFHEDAQNVSLALKDIIEELQSICTEEEYDQMVELIEGYYTDKEHKYVTKAAMQVATRHECYQDIVLVIEPLFYHQHNANGDEHNQRLISLITKGMLYDKCSAYCCSRAVDNTSNENIDKTQVTSSALNNSSITNVNASILHWMYSLNDDVFKQRFRDSDVQIIINKINQSDRLISSLNPTFQNREQSTLKISQSPPGSPKWSKPSNTGDSNALGDSPDPLPHTSSPGRQLPLDATTTKPAENVTTPEPMLKQEDNYKYTNPQDSYANFLAEKEDLRKERDRVLQDLRVKEERAMAIRKNLNADVSPFQDAPSPNYPQQSNPLPSYPSQNAPLPISPHQHTSPVYPAQNAPMSTYTPHSHPSPTQNNPHPFKYYPIEKTEDPSAIRAVAFHPRGEVFAVGSNSQILKICSMPRQRYQDSHLELLGTGVLDVCVKLPKVHKGSIYSTAWNDDGSMLATCSNDKLIKLFDYSSTTMNVTGPSLELTHHNAPVRDVAFLTNYGSACVLANAGADCIVYTNDCEVDAMLHKLSGHSEQVLSLYAWGSGMLVSTSQDKSVRTWDLRTSRCVSVLGFSDASDQSPSVAASVCVDTRGRYMAVGRTDNMISIYDFNAGKIIKTYQAHNNEVRSVRFNPVCPSVLLSGSYDGTAYVTDIEALFLSDHTDPSSYSFRAIHHKDKVIQCRWHPSGRFFATTSADQTCVLWTAYT
uniref:WD repeat-containing protein 47-like n=1 Tax=Ciona intestinalis TaxID=7719 RepID=UPI00052163D7|nr:WD repeat-containing protein 47-like [Ciona intestinalis]|eukprot:XP_026695160.1 WD repeat-containing protein 47-like [Ciona intestinalis]